MVVFTLYEWEHLFINGRSFVNLWYSVNLWREDSLEIYNKRIKLSVKWRENIFLDCIKKCCVRGKFYWNFSLYVKLVMDVAIVRLFISKRSSMRERVFQKWFFLLGYSTRSETYLRKVGRLYYPRLYYMYCTMDCTCGKIFLKRIF